MELKFELDTDKAARATAAIAASYGLGRVSKGTEYPQLAFANAIALMIIIAIFFSTRPAVATKTPPLKVSFQFFSSLRELSDLS